MNRVYTILVILLILVGCAPVDDPRNQELNIITQPGAGKLSESNVIEYFNSVASCITDETLSPSFVLVLQPDLISVSNQLVRGATYIGVRPIVVYLYHPPWQSEGVALSVLSHEIVHVVLDLIGQPVTLNASHDLPGFECAY